MNKKSLACCGLVLSMLTTLPASPLSARDLSLNPSALSTADTVHSVKMVLSAPLIVSAVAADTISGDLRNASTSSSKQPHKQIDAGPIPDMTIKSVQDNPQGGRQVSLEDPHNAANKAVLNWPQSQNDPAAHFVVGQTVFFVPSQNGSGWMLRAEDGAALVFVPTAAASSDSHSQLL